MYEKFVRDRISALRLQKGVSEYKMSYDLGHCRGYINNISSGKSLPSMSEFFAICEYFDLSPAGFFDERKDTAITRKVDSVLDKLSAEDLALILSLAEKFAR